MLKIGFMDYANVYPIFYYLLQDKNLQFIKGYPADLNKLLRAGDIDMSPVSSIEFARNPDNYMVDKNICVSSIGKVKSVNIFSDYPASDLGGKKIYFTKESNTSTVLCKIILEKFYNVPPVYIDNEAEADAKLLIGDKALFSYYNNKSKYIIDLGEEWYKFTKLPFVFALWTINKNAINHSYFPTLKDNIKKYADNFKKDIDTISVKYLEKYSESQIKDYWETIKYEITDNHKKGLSLFYNLAYEIGETSYKATDYIDNAFI